jgi:hypothetical protein
MTTLILLGQRQLKPSSHNRNIKSRSEIMNRSLSSNTNLTRWRKNSAKRWAVATIDLVNEQNKLPIRTHCVTAEFFENTVALGKDQLAPRSLLGSVALNKIFITVSRVECATAQQAESGAIAARPPETSPARWNC